MYKIINDNETHLVVKSTICLMYLSITLNDIFHPFWANRKDLY